MAATRASWIWGLPLRFGLHALGKGQGSRHQQRQSPRRSGRFRHHGVRHSFPEIPLIPGRHLRLSRFDPRHEPLGVAIGTSSRFMKATSSAAGGLVTVLLYFKDDK